MHSITGGLFRQHGNERFELYDRVSETNGKVLNKCRNIMRFQNAGVKNFSDIYLSAFFF
jgi:hypothetical protein